MRLLASVRDVIQKTGLAMPTQQQFIDRYCRTEPAQMATAAVAAIPGSLN